MVADTHIWVWWASEPARLGAEMVEALDTVSPESPLLVPDICLWEVATLVSLNRLRPTIPLGQWLAQAAAPPLVRVVPIDAAIAAEVAALPAHFHRDPADRIIVATARVLGLPLLTADSRIRASGLVSVVGCGR
ncbi:MAG: type II toxin-antitoxin system VapC family toxin [Bradymonadales bacterium]|nr:type II toxin-antitoxin system VapC family toxin [Bradymonadales bacterium]